MSEEDIIKILQHYLEMEEFDNAEDFLVAIDKILDLYQKEKEKNKRYEKYLKSKDTQAIETILNLIEKQSKEIEELKASHITTKNKATNTEKAKIFDVIENSIDTYIEKSKPYWEQIMTKDEMTIDEALTIIDDMYQDRYKIMSQKTEKETIVDLGKMDYIKFTNLEWASVRTLREVQSLNNKLEKWKDKIKAKIEELENQKRQWIEDRDNKHKDSEIIYAIEVLQSLLEKE